MKKLIVLILLGVLGYTGYFISTHKNMSFSEIFFFLDLEDKKKASLADTDEEEDHQSHSQEKKKKEDKKGLKKKLTSKDSQKKNGEEEDQEFNFEDLPESLKVKPTNETESLTSLSQSLVEFTKPGRKYQHLVKVIDNWKLGSKVGVDKNDYTGSMTVVRTREALPGTRYLHAQYFTDEEGEQVLQHLSFEYRPGPHAMTDVVNQVKTLFNVSQKPTMEKKDFISWNKDDGYTVWIKQMGEDDIKDDPFNAYTKQDIGTIRVAIELEIHGQESDDHGNHRHVSP